MPLALTFLPVAVRSPSRSAALPVMLLSEPLTTMSWIVVRPSPATLVLIVSVPVVPTGLTVISPTCRWSPVTVRTFPTSNEAGPLPWTLTWAVPPPA